MPLILHLSDLHLGQATEDSSHDDYSKSGIVGSDERPKRIDILGETLAQLAKELKSQGRALDAIAITGDITSQNDERGFDDLERLLSRLGDCRPASAGSTIVVPGNHDVQWDAPNPAARYEYFIKYVRNKGYVTPYLDEIDKQEQETEVRSHFVVGPSYQWMLIPINTSHYCGVLEPMSDSVKNELVKDTSEAAQEGLRELRMRDAARVSPWQLNMLRDALQQLEQEAAEANLGFNGTRIAVMHHQLLPVSMREEVKTFESIINLGLVRSFLRTNRIDVLLHGHKHTGYIYWDHIYPFEEQTGSSDDPHRVLVISGSTLAGEDYDTREVARLIDLKANLTAPAVSIERLSAVEAGGKLTRERGRLVSLWPNSQSLVSDPYLVIGNTSAETYSRLQSLFSNRSPSEVHNLMCEVKTAESAAWIPPDYPKGVEARGESPQEWFAKQVEWWQHPNVLPNAPHMPFTHGNRIFAFREGLDQFERAVAVLRGTERDRAHAIMTLLDPARDDIKGRRKFPAFCTIQFVIRESPNGESRLDCVGTFRKQEVRYWWPVNLAELQQLQKKMFDRLSAVIRGLQIGRLVTFTAIAYRTEPRPRVDVPLVDRVALLNEQQLWLSIYAFFWKDMPEREQYRVFWHSLLDDLTSVEAMDPDGAPIAVPGVRYLFETATRFAESHPTSRGRDLVDCLQNILKLNVAYAKEREADLDSAITSHAEWTRQLAGAVAKAKRVIDSAYSEDTRN